MVPVQPAATREGSGLTGSSSCPRCAKIVSVIRGFVEGATVMAEGDQPEAASPKRTDAAERVRLGIPVAIAVVVGVFVALGIEGDVRARLVRNAPNAVSAAFSLAMVGLALPLLDLATNRKRRRLIGTLGGIVLLLGAVLAVVIGARGLSDRENPALSITPVLVDEDVVRVDVAASAPTLRSDEKMLVRVAAVRLQALPLLRPLCEDEDLVTSSWPPKELATPVANIPEPLRVLHWGETGPNSNGNASQSITVQVLRTEFSHVCVYAALFTKPGGEPRATLGLADLRAAVPPS
jgi:hypothetical protein